MTPLMSAAHALTQRVPGGMPPQTQVGGGEAVLFWICAPLIVVAALGLLFAKKAVHAAMCTAFVMINLAVLYAALDAQFLFAAQIVVYTGAVMMLFLFVLMLVGIDTTDSMKETIKGHRVVTGLAVAGLLLFVAGAFSGYDLFKWNVNGMEPTPIQGLAEANKDGNPQGVAKLIFGEYVVALQLVGTLLISAAVGAIVLTHKERLTAKVTQADLAAQRVRDNTFVAGMPAPGVFARHNSIDTPALLPDGSLSEASVSRVLRARGQEVPVEEVEDAVGDKLAALQSSTHGRLGTEPDVDDSDGSAVR